jgi:hypothetical protein
MISGAYMLGYNSKPYEIKVVENTCITRLLDGQAVNGYRLIQKRGKLHPYLKKEVADARRNEGK